MKIPSLLFGILVVAISCIEKTSQISDNTNNNTPYSSYSDSSSSSTPEKENLFRNARYRALTLEREQEDNRRAVLVLSRQEEEEEEEDSSLLSTSTTAAAAVGTTTGIRQQQRPHKKKNNTTKSKVKRKMTTTTTTSIEPEVANNSTTLGYTVSEIQVGVIGPEGESEEYGKILAGNVQRMFPDRLTVTILNNENEDIESWPKVHILVLACSKSNFPFEKVQKYVNLHQDDNAETGSSSSSSSMLVLTDLDLSRNLSDRRTFYNVLVAGGLGTFLPRYAYVNRDGYVGMHESKVHELADRRDQIEVNGQILLKPVLERPVDPTDPEIRVYYPRSDGGGCKIIKFVDGELGENRSHTAHFEADVSRIRKDSNSSFIYEELSEVPSIVVRQKETTRDRIKGFVTKKERATASFGDEEQISYESDLSRKDRKIVIVTTASIPWMTGTAVNPLLRAAYLKQGRPKGSVTLVIPWLDKEEDQVAVYGTDKFSSPEEQELRVRAWLRDHAGMPEEADPETGIKILWYPSRYVSGFGSIFPTGDICKMIPDEDADFCILEEPEHLNWFRGEGEGEIWTEKFKHVVGVIHTNYRAYASQTTAGMIAAPFVTGLSTLMVRAYCDKVIKLSATLQTYSPEKEVVSNVHGVRADFIEEGKRRGEQAKLGVSPEVYENDTPVYFIGKLLWDKGLDHLLRLEYFYKQITGEFFPLDIVGDGPDRAEIEAAFGAQTRAGKVFKTLRKLLAIDQDDATSEQSFRGINPEILESKKSPTSLFEIPASMLLHASKVPVTFHGRKDHAHFCPKYKVLVNPSTTEVLCTTVAEALAMGKFVIIPRHPSNEFFYQFRNCLVYENKVEFVRHMHYALTNEPKPLSPEEVYKFTWEGATERLIKASSITMKEGRARARARTEGHDKRIAKTYNKIGARGELLRMILDGGAPANSTFSDSESNTMAGSNVSDYSDSG